MVRTRNDSDRDLGALVNRIARDMRQQMTLAARPLGLTAPQAAVLLTLAAGAMPVGAVAERLDMDRPTMTGLTERLVRDGWAVLAPNPEDRRSKLIGLTPSAHAALPALRAAGAGINARAVRTLTPAEREELLTLLGRIATDIDR